MPPSNSASAADGSASGANSANASCVLSSFCGHGVQAASQPATGKGDDVWRVPRARACSQLRSASAS